MVLGGTVLPIVGEPVPVVQIGDDLHGESVLSFSAHDPLGADETNPDGERLAFWVSTAEGEHIVHATRLTPDSTSTSALTAPAMQPIAAVQPAATSQPVLTAMVVSNTAPVAGESVQITNRSSSGGFPVSSTLDRGDGSTPVTVRGGNSTSVSWSASGDFDLSIEASSGSDSLRATITMAVSPRPNRTPVADAGGPYEVAPGDGLVLDASGSTDPDGQADIVSWAWDLNGDGAFDEASGSTVSFTRAEVEATFCDGSCTDGEGRGIRLRVTDSAGNVSDDAATVVVYTDPRDFTLTLAPATQQIYDSATFLVEATSLGGFDDYVSLSIDGLPTGWSAGFSPSSFTPDGSSLLTVHAPSDLSTTEELPFTVTATSGGGITHTAGATASVVLALPPVCTTSIHGTVVDRDTGQPVAGATVTMFPAGIGFPTWQVTTAADGTWSVADGIPVVSRFAVGVTADGYYNSNTMVPTVCGVDAVADLDVLAVRYGSVAGRVVVGVPDPSDVTQYRDVSPTDTPVPFAQVSAGGQTVTADSDGSFRIDGVALNVDNQPRTIGVTGRLDGYWYDTESVRFEADQTSTVVVALVPMCSMDPTMSATGRAVDQDGNPVSGLFVYLGTSQFDPLDQAYTAADGSFSLGPVPFPLPYDNSLQGTFVNTTGYLEDGTRVANSSRSDRIDAWECNQVVDGHVDLPVDLLPPPPVEHHASVAGVVTDAETGAPVSDADVSLSPYGLASTVQTGTDGSYRFDDVLVGVDDTTSRQVTISAGPGYASPYWPTTNPPATLTADTTLVQDVALVPKHFSQLTGVVVDKATGQPIERAIVGIPDENQSAATDTDGRFTISRIEPGDRNTPKTVHVTAIKNYPDVGSPGRYFLAGQDVVLTPGGTTEIRFELVRACDNTVVSGTVLDASTLAPLPSATVGILYVPSDGPVTTDEGGQFTITGIHTGFDNEPTGVQVQATKSGYVSRTKTVTVFCGASITVDFGAPVEATGAVTGTVTDVDTGQPLAGVQVVAGTGTSVITGADGTYRLDGLPTPSGGTRTWEVTAIEPTRGQEVATSVVISDGSTTTQDFSFGFPNTPPVGDDQAVTTAPSSPSASSSRAAIARATHSSSPSPASPPTARSPAPAPVGSTPRTRGSPARTASPSPCPTGPPPAHQPP